MRAMGERNRRDISRISKRVHKVNIGVDGIHKTGFRIESRA